jgi:hypothetical protein
MSTKREFRISSEDSARPAPTISDVPPQHCTIKPKERHLVDVVYEETGEVIPTKGGADCEIILKTQVYNDGTYSQRTVGSENEAYKEYKRTGIAVPQTPTKEATGRATSKKVQEALKKAAKANAVPVADKE